MYKTLSLALGLAVLTLGACDPFDVGNVRGDGGGGGSGNADGSQNPGTDGNSNIVDPNCLPGVTPNGDGHHNPGLDCSAGGCHLPGGAGADAPEFTLAGTLYTDLAGATPVAGGTILLTDANLTEIPLTTESNGNFYTSQALAFPVTIKASKCPNSLSMTMPVQQGAASCNTAGCHAAGNRAYLPE